MARVPYVPVEQIDATHVDLLGRPINLGQALVNSSEGYRNHHMLGAWIRSESTIDPRLRELLILQVGFISKSEYEFSHHVKISQQFGVTEEDIRNLIRFNGAKPNTLSEADRDALTAARELTEEADVSDTTWAKLAARYPNDQLVELMLVVGYYNHVIRLLRALRIDVEPEYQPYLRQFPLG
jgi:alkylhydroperoxidase family enzyme